MRLLEVLDIGSFRSVLAVKQGEANKRGIPLEIPFAALQSYLEPLGINSPDALIAVKNKIDPTGDVISDVLQNGTVILNTKVPSDEQDAQPKKATGPSVDKMASANSKNLSPNI